MTELTASEELAIDQALGLCVGEVEDDDELRSEDERAITEFVGSEEAPAEACETEAELASAAAAFLAGSPVDARHQKKVERRKRHRQRLKEEAATRKEQSTQATTAFVRIFGAAVSKDALHTFFVDKCGQGTVVRVQNGKPDVLYVQVAKPDLLRRALDCNGTKLGAARLSVKPALTKLGLDDYVQRKKKRSDAPPASPPDPPPKKAKATPTPRHTKLKHRRSRKQPAE